MLLVHWTRTETRTETLRRWKGQVLPEPTARTAARGPGRRVAFIDIARSIAAVLVVYTHIDMLWLRDNYGLTTPITAAIDQMLTIPLKLDDRGQGLGQISVPIFFLVSGFVITPMALRHGSARFGVNRLLRIYPTLAFAVLISAVAFIGGARPLTTGKVGDVTLTKIATDMTLANFLMEPQSALVGVAWTLIVEVIFYLFVLILLPLFLRNVALAIAVELTVVHVVLMTHAHLGGGYRLFAVNLAYLIIPIMGQAIWAAHSRRISTWIAGGYLAICWLLFGWAARANIHENYHLRTLPVAIALTLFLLGLLAEPHLRVHRFWTELSERSYSIYLLHGAVAFPVLHLGYRHMPLWLLIPLALLITAIAVEICYRLIEQPSHQLARRVTAFHAGRRRTEADTQSNAFNSAQHGVRAQSETVHDPLDEPMPAQTDSRQH